MCKTSPEKVAPPEMVTDRRFRPNLGCSRGDNDPKFFHTPRRVPSYVARHTAKNGRQCHSFLTPFLGSNRRTRESSWVNFEARSFNASPEPVVFSKTDLSHPADAKQR